MNVNPSIAGTAEGWYLHTKEIIEKGGHKIVVQESACDPCPPCPPTGWGARGADQEGRQWHAGVARVVEGAQ